MANTNFALKPAPHGNRAELSGLGGGRLHWTMAPETTWVATVRHTDFAGAAQTTTLALPALAVSGRLTGTFTRAGEEVVVTTDLAAGDDQDRLATDFAAALEGEGELDAWRVVASSNAEEVEIVWSAGALVSTSFSFAPAQVLELAASGTLVAGTYRFTVSGAGLAEPVVVALVWAGGTAANFAIALEAALEGEVELDGVVVSADDDGAGTCAVLFAPGLADAEIEVETPPIAHIYELTSGGTPTNGDYVATVVSSLLPGPVPVTVTRAGGNPATNALLAAAFEAAFEAHPQLAPLVVSADDTGAVNEIATYPGVELTITTSAPAPATLAATDQSDPPPAVAVADDTPATPSLSVSHALAIALNDLQPRNPFPAHVVRLECPLVRRLVAWSATATIALDNGGTPFTDVLTAVSVSSGTGWLGDTGTSLGSVEVPEEAWSPRLVLTSATLAPTAGAFELHVGFCPMPS